MLLEATVINAVLAIGHVEDLLVIHQFRQRDVVEEIADALAQVAPQNVGQAALAALATLFTLAFGGVNGFVHRVITAPTAIAPASLPNR